jgi:hypothetical protein
VTYFLTEAAKILKNYGASLNLMDQSGHTPMSLNFQMQEPIFRTDEIQNYVAESCETTFKPFSKKSPTYIPVTSNPLHHAIASSKWNNVLEMIRSGADIHSYDSHYVGRSAIDLALEKKLPTEGKINKNLQLLKPCSV